MVNSLPDTVRSLLYKLARVILKRTPHPSQVLLPQMYKYENSAQGHAAGTQGHAACL